MPLDTLMRISAVLGILFPDRATALRWLRSPPSPMAVMVFGTQDGLLQVRRHLDAWRDGALNDRFTSGSCWCR